MTFDATDNIRCPVEMSAEDIERMLFDADLCHFCNAIDGFLEAPQELFDADRKTIEQYLVRLLNNRLRRK